LILKPLGFSHGTSCDFEQARNLNFKGAVILVDGRRVNSYDELFQLAIDVYRDKKSFEVVVLPVVTGG
jgi:hypothetical protein